jgi:hypothetical protein
MPTPEIGPEETVLITGASERSVGSNSNCVTGKSEGDRRRFFRQTSEADAFVNAKKISP